MKKVLNQIIQLQELQLAVAEQQASSAKAPSEDLAKAIHELTAALPPEVSNRYDRLQKRHPMVVVPVVRGACPLCAISLPVALVNDVRAGESIQACPHCGRFLYYPDSVARQPAKKSFGDKILPKGIARFSAESLMIPHLKAETREEAVAELATAMGAAGFIENADAVTELALKREAMISTAVENGLAFPHVRNVEGGGLTLAMGMKPKGLPFGAPDDKATKIVFLMVIPTPSSAFYLRLLAGLVKTFADAEARKTMLEGDTPAAMWKTLTKLTRTHVA
jgi:mannitol/fructose-specific phosphotransferase system IIA component (Ntr-type)